LHTLGTTRCENSRTDGAHGKSANEGFPRAKPGDTKSLSRDAGVQEAFCDEEGADGRARFAVARCDRGIHRRFEIVTGRQRFHVGPLSRCLGARPGVLLSWMSQVRILPGHQKSSEEQRVGRVIADAA